MRSRPGAARHQRQWAEILVTVAEHVEGHERDGLR
jgi:hypothetical protein